MSPDEPDDPDEPGAGPPVETLGEFKDSFFHGSRSDLNVKFLAGLPADEAGRFLAEMLASIGGLLDDGDPTGWCSRSSSGNAARVAGTSTTRRRSRLSSELT